MTAVKISKNYKKLASLKRFEEVTGESQTVPNETLTIRRLLEKYKAGSPDILVGRQPLYFDVEDINAITHIYGQSIDFTDLDDLRARNEELNSLIEEAEAKRIAEEQNASEPAPDTVPEPAPDPVPEPAPDQNQLTIE